MIGKNIAEIRKRRGYTLSELSNQAKISKSYLSNIERNINRNPSIDVLQKIAKVLNVDLLTLLKSYSVQEAPPYIEKEWVDFVFKLKQLGLKKEHLDQYGTLIEFIKWKNQISESNDLK
ncbi:helix-turn-helix domain-containing protein [Heyndrickxia oleronia]|jgi:XRE family transcriptional regulator of biofilm formation|uniref:helix-turn-helix domain-containing protein n=1 Tax=Heyndrickxia oleronia TaxID=38875 RepID=UPI00242B5046|nr:helix-turn-helix transcriptional regulator [Heyndrickxia oleronia]MCI1590672.1 helix-turn-helix domain-containing protein [Heyndrickxia oleronia]MCI1612139.1 helix-turn-helix domain-containing protein [Heyndrickxia oleronia]MCI1759848.1 helix-turn-helix domain-containing protein [Heyndrickxia oleronia]